jgi:hypothetical protein
MVAKTICSWMENSSTVLHYLLLSKPFLSTKAVQCNWSQDYWCRRPRSRLYSVFLSSSSLDRRKFHQLGKRFHVVHEAWMTTAELAGHIPFDQIFVGEATNDQSLQSLESKFSKSISSLTCNGKNRYHLMDEWMTSLIELGKGSCPGNESKEKKYESNVNLGARLGHQKSAIV